MRRKWWCWGFTANCSRKTQIFSPLHTQREAAKPTGVLTGVAPPSVHRVSKSFDSLFRNLNELGFVLKLRTARVVLHPLLLFPHRSRPSNDCTMRGEVCVGVASILSFASMVMLIFVHIGQINTSTVPRRLSMAKVNASGYGDSLAVFIRPDNVTGLYTLNASAPLQAGAGLRQHYEFGLYSYCAFVDADERAGICSNQTVGTQFRPYDALTGDMALNYSILTNNFLPALTFSDGKYTGSLTKAAYWMLLLGTICAALALLTGIAKNNLTFFVSAIFSVVGSILLLIGASESLPWCCGVSPVKSDFTLTCVLDMLNVFDSSSAVQFTTYEQLKKWFTRHGSRELDTPKRLASGALAGITSVCSTYPLDLVRSRLSIATASIQLTNPAVQAASKQAAATMPLTQTAKHAMASAYHTASATASSAYSKADLTIWGMTLKIVREEGGIKALYRGLVTTAVGVAPYVGINFAAYEFLRGIITPPGKSSVPRKLACGALAGSISQTLTYPFDVLRRKMQVTGMRDGQIKYNGAIDAMKSIIRVEGVAGMYRGLWPNLLKVAPSIATSFFTYELVKEFLVPK
ncbi:unnamed protein product [Cyclocybe aegerita]|uniref:Mitochondrial carrier protein n=1 Tax=Cyclocybe aegerita TaxID=1973307 RepID=A0A8S0VTK8_CYCAE|nr:unnamed protein product [Cyclocybe aegerita]